MLNPKTKKNMDEFGDMIRCRGGNALKDNKGARAHSDRGDEVINEALAEEMRRGEKNEKRSNKATVEAQETGAAAASATTTVTGPAAGPARDNQTEPDARRKLLMK